MPNSVAQRLDKLDELPTITRTLHRVLHDLESVSATVKSLERLIRDDPALSAKILRIANSSYYGLPGEVSSIARAVVILGFEEVKNLVIGISLTNAFSGEFGFEEFDANGLWLHSVGTALAAQMLGAQVPGLDPEVLFTAGLLHDIGRILLCLHFEQELREILALRQREAISVTMAEERYGLMHGEVGAYLATKWGLSELLINVVRYHHYPKGAGPHATAAATVFLADSLCQKVGLGWTMEGEVEKILVPKILGLSGENVREVALKLRKGKDRIVNAWSGVIEA